MATPKASQTPAKVYRPSFLDTTGDLRPSVERELVSISNSMQTQQVDIDALKRHMTAEEAIAAGFITVGTDVKFEPDGTAIEVGPNFIKINTIIRSSVTSGTFTVGSPLYKISKIPFQVPNGKTLRVIKPYGPALMEVNHLGETNPAATRTADCWTPKMNNINTNVILSSPSNAATIKLDWLMIRDEWFFDVV